MDRVKFKLLNCRKLKLESDADMVVLPAEDGEIGVLPKHIDMVIKLKAGNIKIYQNDSHNKISVLGGIAKITGFGIEVIENIEQDSVYNLFKKN